MLAALKEVKSYAAVAFKNEAGEELGVLSLTSTRPWFFVRPYQFALEALAKRIGFLVGHLKHKGRLTFISQATPRLAEIEDLDDLKGELARAMRRFCEEVSADWGSLYVWDEDRNCFILRAEHGWQKKEWVDVARYGKDEGWTGTIASEGRPVRIPDIDRHYKELGYRELYTIHAIGDRFSSKGTIEAISLPLLVGGRTVAWLTLYRRKSEVADGFLSIDDNDLLRIASDIAGLLSVLQSRQAVLWERREKRRHQEVNDYINLPHEHFPFKARVCLQVLSSFRAIRADFYKVVTIDQEAEIGDQETRIIWAEGFKRNPNTGKIEETTDLPPDLHDIVIETFSRNQSVLGEVRVERQRVREEDRERFELAATEGMVKRACIPLVGEKRLLGVLDLHWLIGPRQAPSLDAQHNSDHLRLLGEMIGAVYLRRQIRARADQSGLAVSATGALSFQQSHRLGNLVQRIYRLAQIIAEKKDQAVRERNARRLLSVVETAIDIIGSARDYGKDLLHPFRESDSLLNLMRQALGEIDQDKQRQVRRGKVKVKLSIPSDIFVYANSELTKECFVNLLNNAIQAILNKVKGASSHVSVEENVVTISASVTADMRSVTTSITDTGVGMSKEQIEAALTGFINTQGHTGVGVLVSRVLINIQGGLLEYVPEKESGTEVKVTLPLAYREGKPHIVRIIRSSRKENNCEPSHY